MPGAPSSASGPAHRPRRSEHLTVVEIDGEQVVYDPVRAEAHLLNATAAAVLDRCDGKTTLAELADELGDRYGVDPRDLAPDLDATMADFTTRGLIDQASSPPSQDATGPAGGPGVGAGRGPVPDRWAWESPVMAALGVRFRLRTDDELAARYLESVFGSLARTPKLAARDAAAGPDAPPVVTFDLVAADRPVRLLLDGVDVSLGDDLDAVMSFLHWRLNQLAIERTPDRVLLHASAVRRPDGVVVLPAESNSGKSTLAAGLVRAGFGYVTDEAVAIDPETGHVEPYPKPISLDPGSWPLFADRAPTIEGDRAADDRDDPGFFQREWHLDPRALSPTALDDLDAEQLVSLVAFPRYEEGTPTHLEPLRPAVALLGLMRNAFNLATVGPPGIAALTAIALHVPVGQLTVGDLDAAVDLLGPPS